ncbi:MAG TPA: GDSL-type esterase/lipase family protein [Chitinophagales bacterium]|nr:GDSL-type esterase/lipase family protein [Chitinophagales bacterium]
MSSKLKYWTFITLFTLGTLEILFRLFGLYQTYTESIGMGYQSYFNNVSPNFYHTWQPDDTFILDHNDFAIPYQTNELGLREIPLDSFAMKSADGFRILAFGDSFTEGVGADYENSWPRYLEKLLRQSGTDVHIFNAGVNGSDPFFEYVLFRDKLKAVHPQLVIVAINSSDVDDYHFRGGMERFQTDGMVINRKGPWYEPLYEHSYVFRFVVEMVLGMKPQLFITPKQYQKVMDDFVRQTALLMEEFKKLLPDPGKLLVVVFPAPREVYDDADKNMKGNLLRLLAEVKSRGVDTLSLYRQFESEITEKNLPEYTYKNDGHFKPKGYLQFAKFLAPVVDSLLYHTQEDTPAISRRL